MGLNNGFWCSTDGVMILFHVTKRAVSNYVTTFLGHGSGHGAVLSGDLAAQQLSPHAPHSLAFFCACAFACCRRSL